MSILVSAIATFFLEPIPFNIESTLGSAAFAICTFKPNLLPTSIKNSSLIPPDDGSIYLLAIGIKSSGSTFWPIKIPTAYATENIPHPTLANEAPDANFKSLYLPCTPAFSLSIPLASLLIDLLLLFLVPSISSIEYLSWLAAKPNFCLTESPNPPIKSKPLLSMLENFLPRNPFCIFIIIDPAAHPITGPNNLPYGA